MKFIRSVSNLTYENMEDFKEFMDDPSLLNIDMAALSLKVNVFLLQLLNVFIF